MTADNRKSVRYNDVGRIDAGGTSLFPGMLLDISQTGCRCRFPCLIDFDEEEEYLLRILPSHKNTSHSFALLGRPVWQKKDDSSTTAGFEFLHSPDGKRLMSYIEQLKQEENNEEEDALTVEPRGAAPAP
ncbi:MAG: PilZ domain-containing protein [Spirochaetaceae bacterium]|nr:PilZ domain-containing protein [Spirochaetaceae bacterium]